MCLVTLQIVYFSLLFCAIPSETSGRARDDGYTPTEDEKARQDIVQMLERKKDHHCPDVEDRACPRPEVTFWLYTRDTWDTPVKLDPSKIMNENPGFVTGVPLKILIHGYTKDKDTAINEVLRPAYFAVGEYNIMSVDWSPLARDHCYVQAARSVPTVGHCVAFTLSAILRTHGHLFSDVHLLGHSMGAHVASWASRELDLPRCTLLDPALPLFSEDDSLLKRAQAGLVDVWHSNSNLYGREKPSGEVDIYFNDEMDQPGCQCHTSCSHLRAVQYYGETISGNTPLFAFPCAEGWEGYRHDHCPVPRPQDLAQFGETYTPNTYGDYLAFTNDASPFIIPKQNYLNEEQFKSFEETHDEHCKKHEFIAFFLDLFDL